MRDLYAPLRLALCDWSFPFRAERMYSLLNNKATLRPVTMETRCFHKKLEFQRYPPKDFCTARYEHKSSKKSFKLFENPEKKVSWADLEPRSA